MQYYRLKKRNKDHILVELYNSGQNSFYSNLMKMSEYFNIFDLITIHWATARLSNLWHEKEICLLLEPDASALT